MMPVQGANEKEHPFNSRPPDDVNNRVLFVTSLQQRGETTSISDCDDSDEEEEHEMPNPCITRIILLASLALLLVIGLVLYLVFRDSNPSQYAINDRTNIL